MVTNLEDIQTASKNSLDASLKSFGTLSKSLQAIAVETADYAKKAFEEGSAAGERLASAKSFDKVMEVQSAYLKSAYESFVAQSSKLGQLYVDMAQEAYKPFEARFVKPGVAK